MASSQHRTLTSPNKGTSLICVTFYPQNTGAVVNANNKGRGATVARTASAGVFTVTLTERYANIVGVLGQVGLATAADMAFQAGTVAVARTAANTVSIRTQAGATATDIAANANNYVTVVLIVQREQAA